MNVLSLFDGISCAQIALARAGIKVKNYFASEIDANAIKVTQHNYPKTQQLGDVYFVTTERLPKIDLLIGGSPCTSLSIAARQKESGLQKGESTLFYEYLRVLKEVKPTWFLLENVASMKNDDRDKISHALGVKPVFIDSALVSAQMRKRLYWCGQFNKTQQINITQPADKGIALKDILENGYMEKDKSYCLTATADIACLRDDLGFGQRQMIWNKPIRVTSYKGKKSQGYRVYSIDGKSVCLCANGGGLGAQTGLYEVLKGYARKLYAIEAERLQTVPDNYTNIGLSDNHRVKLLGNAFTVDVIAHILKHIPEEQILTKRRVA